MDLVKKNWLSIAFGVIAILAIAADFWPMAGKYEQLRGEANKSVAVNNELKTLESKPRNEPITKVETATAEAKPLTVFPTEKVTAAGKTAIEKLAEGAKHLSAEVVKMNIHQPLVQYALPGQAENKTPLINFARQYVDALDVSTPKARGQSIAGTLLHADIPPNETEITAAKEAEKNRITNEMALRDASNNITNQQQIDTEVAAAQLVLPDNLRRKVAEECMVYIDPTTFTSYQAQTPIAVGMAPDPTTIFWAQVGLWTQEDFCKAVYAINSLPMSDGKKPANVMEAPIKHIVKISIPQSQQTGVLFVGVAAAPSDPNAAPAPPADPKPNYAAPPLGSPFGRVSNGMYDVLQFDVLMRVEADRLPMILEELGRGRFMTVVQVVSVTAVDSSQWHLAGYFYGNKPIVEVQLKLENLFLREWTKPLMPLQVRQRLGIPPDAPPTNPA